MDFIYQDEDILVLNKPAGLITTDEGRGDGDTAEKWLMQFSWTKDLDRSGICHRLDKDTSGILLVAKNAESVMAMKRQFKNREIKKTYLALVNGVTTKYGEIKVPIGRSKIFAKWGIEIDGKAATTVFTRLAIYKDVLDKKYALLELKPKTGRTHQIRVHCAYMGWPLVGDSRYGGGNFLLARQFLHASGMEIIHPKTGKILQFESKLTDDLKKTLDSLLKIG